MLKGKRQQSLPRKTLRHSERRSMVKGSGEGDMSVKMRINKRGFVSAKFNSAKSPTEVYIKLISQYWGKKDSGETDRYFVLPTS